MLKKYGTHSIVKILEIIMIFMLQLDTLLLADCLENFRNACQKEYELDPCYFVSTPGLGFEAFLKKHK